MQIVVEIDDEVYKEIKEGLYDKNVRKMAIAIGNGTPLPKGHGRLIDADAINIHDISPIYEMEVYGVTQDDIEYEPTIIEADKESELNERK